MSGLALGIQVSYPPGMRAPPRGDARELTLYVQEGEALGQAPRAMGYVLQGDASEPAPDSIVIPGTPLILTRGQPTDITVVNRLDQPTGLHWHGLELESFWDGVAGWSGSGDEVASAIEPGESFVARLSRPRAGTFIYHSHLNDVVQLTSGLYGALIVLEPGEVFDPKTDHIVITGWDGPGPEEAPPPALVNGAFTAPEPLPVEAGVPHRFRLINIGPARPMFYSISQNGSPIRWRQTAKDGWTFPPTMQEPGPSILRLNIGETADVMVEFEPGEYELMVELPQAAPRAYVQRIVAR
jgi:FtsP/CotA-like multicopper oxidase with cupredoxin domain